jgi:site-specific DNA recombinase
MKEDEIRARLERQPADTPDIHPNVAGTYRRKVERLAEALGNPEERDEAADAIRSLIEKIILTLGAKRGQLDASLHGDLGAILQWTAQRTNGFGRDSSGMSVSVVAGAGNQLWRTFIAAPALCALPRNQASPVISF